MGVSSPAVEVSAVPMQMVCCVLLPYAIAVPVEVQCCANANGKIYIPVAKYCM